MNVKQIADVAVIVGRYQTFQLHSEQVRMIAEVVNRHPRTIIVLGNSLMRGTIANPLDFRARKTMIRENFPEIDILYINDIPINNSLWSINLDKLIKDNLSSNETVAIYGSKDSFITKYNGKFTTFEFDASSFISADVLRKQASVDYHPDEQYRAGVFSAQSNRYPVCYQAVDVAIVDDAGRILLGRKPNEKLLRFIGGFSDPTSISLEHDARREVGEETSVEADGFAYLGSALIESDPRYFNEVDKIKSAFFVAKYIFGRPTAKDDIAEVTWVSIETLTKDIIEPIHHVLVDIFNNKFIQNKTLYNSYIVK